MSGARTAAPQTKLTLDNLVPYNFDDLLFDILDHGHTHYVLKGGRGSGKSSVIGLAIILLLTAPENKDMHAIVFRKTGNTLRDSVFAQIQFTISLLGLDKYFKYTYNPMKMTYMPTGQTILFRGLDDKYKLKSLKAPFGYYAITWLEEADTFAGMEEIRTLLQSTMRGGSKFWVFMSFNPPISSSNFMNQEVLIPRPDRVVHHSDYRTVPREWLGDQFIDEAEILKETNPRAYKHELLGIPVGTGGEVFDNLEIREITAEEIGRFDRIYMGIDWGWYPDPYHWSKMYYDTARQTLYIFDEYRANKQSNRITWDVLRLTKGVTGSDLITADSAEPKSIADYRDYGALCRGVEKGPDSVRYSMKWLQSRVKIVIDPARCPYTAKEFSTYEYERTSDNEIINSYPDRDNHAIDSVRYGTFPIWKRKGQ